MLTTEVTEHLTMFTTLESTLPQSTPAGDVTRREDSREGSNVIVIAVGVSMGMVVLILSVALVIVTIIAVSSCHSKHVATDMQMQVQHTVIMYIHTYIQTDTDTRSTFEELDSSQDTSIIIGPQRVTRFVHCSGILYTA